MRPRRRRTPLQAVFRALTPAPRRRPRPRRAVAKPRASGTWQRESHRSAAGARAYFVYVPAGVRRTRVPLVVLLHGCGQTPAEFAAATRFNELADRHGFVAVYPEQPSLHHANRCWRWYDAAHQGRGSGEPAIIAGITADVVESTRWAIDPDRVYVAGLSAGGAMALILGATYADRFAAVGVHSAPAYGSASSLRGALAAMAGRSTVPAPGDGGMPPAIVFQGASDRAVHARNGQRVADQSVALHAALAAGPKDRDRVVRTTVGTVVRGGRSCTTARWYTARGGKQVEYWLVGGLGHAWSGGAPGGSYSDPAGPRASTVMWGFFATKRRRVHPRAAA